MGISFLNKKLIGRVLYAFGFTNMISLFLVLNNWENIGYTVVLFTVYGFFLFDTYYGVKNKKGDKDKLFIGGILCFVLSLPMFLEALRIIYQ